MPQLWSCNLTPVSGLTIQLNAREGRTLCQGSSPPSSSRSAHRSRFPSRPKTSGISCGSSCRSASSVITSSPRAWAKPALRAAALPKLRRNRSPVTRGSAAAKRRITSHEPSVEPSSTKTTSRSYPAVSGNLAQLLVENCQAFRFVEYGNHDGEHGEGFRVRGSGFRCGIAAIGRCDFFPSVPNPCCSHS